MEKRKHNDGVIPYIIFCIILLILGFWLIVSINIIQDKDRRLEFESLKEGLCIYIEYDPWQGYTYCLVYDYDVEQVIEVDLYDELIHTDISVGDTIVYVVDYDYTDADFINVIKGE